MNIVLWVLQVFLGIYFLAIGIMHFVVPPGLPAQMSWMYDLPDWLHWVSGIAEILGGLGLILPSATRIKPWLTPLAALGLAVVMGGAVVYHALRGEWMNITLNIINAAVLLFVAYGRWKLRPIEEK
jgi:uncharacterized membrane protein